MAHKKRQPIAESAIKYQLRTPQYACKRQRPAKGKGAYRRNWNMEGSAVQVKACSALPFTSQA